MKEGWYLMSTGDLEIELARWRGDAGRPPSRARRLSVKEALAYRNAGNLPDELGRTLRLVLRIDDPSDLLSLDAKRLVYEPDFLAAPTWRQPGSKPVNVVPLRAPDVEGPRGEAWLDDPEMAALEAEWERTGGLDGVAVPAEYRSFVYKTVALLRSTDTDVTVESISDSVARWLDPPDADRVRAALLAANQGEQRG